MNEAPAMVPVDDLVVHAFEIPTDGPDGSEQDGSLTWSSTTIVITEVSGGGQTGIGYTYAEPATAALISAKLASVVRSTDALAPGAAWRPCSKRCATLVGRA